MKELSIYLKTTETCNLNCKHCFTNGSNGSKIYWNHIKVADWLKRLKEQIPNTPHVHLDFHGGEPFLADIHTLQYVYDNCKNLWKSQSWGVTTNLTFKLTQDIIDFIQGPLKNRVGTSWDPDIRFANPKQYDLWRKNVDTLVKLGVDIKLFVSVTKGTIAIEPLELLEWIRDLGVKELALERLTMNGNAKQNLDIFPTNLEQDEWFLRMHHQSEKVGAREWLVNEFLESVYDKFEKGYNSAATFCRDCEEKLFTLNADGTIAGCPNSAPEAYFGNIDQDIVELLNSPQRLENIACERARDPRCYDCEVFQYCNSDCHQLEWQNDICGAPKSLMIELSKINMSMRKKIINIKELKCQ
jgi:radical SAM protein with 4Fe4S-binding SPASM domain